MVVKHTNRWIVTFTVVMKHPRIEMNFFCMVKTTYPISNENSFPRGTNSWKTRYLCTRFAEKGNRWIILLPIQNQTSFFKSNSNVNKKKKTTKYLGTQISSDWNTILKKNSYSSLIWDLLLLLYSISIVRFKK